MTWLKTANIPFYLRIKKDSKVPKDRAVRCKPGEASVIPDAITMIVATVYLSRLRLADGGLLLVVSGQACPEAIAFTASAGRLKLGLFA